MVVGSSIRAKAPGQLREQWGNLHVSRKGLQKYEHGRPESVFAQRSAEHRSQSCRTEWWQRPAGGEQACQPPIWKVSLSSHPFKSRGIFSHALPHPERWPGSCRHTRCCQSWPRGRASFSCDTWTRNHESHPLYNGLNVHFSSPILSPVSPWVPILFHSTTGPLSKQASCSLPLA